MLIALAQHKTFGVNGDFPVSNISLEGYLSTIL
jgi:hypothetical protein